VSAAPARIAVLASGEGTNLQTLIDAAAAGRLRGEICGVLSDRSNARCLQRARAASIEARAVRVAPTHEPDYDADMCAALLALQPDVVVLAGYMRIMSEHCVTALGERMLNLHPSLLPKHKGNDTHARALAAGDAVHGATVHFVTAELDGGPPVIQYRIAVTQQDDVDTLSARVHRGEYIILPMAVEWFCAGRLHLRDGEVMLDGELLRQPVIIEEDQ
jgi:phosphoribosylglycinamide formyltransferase-1